MTLTQIRNRIHALQRRFGLPLTIIRLRPYATPVLRTSGPRPRSERSPYPRPRPSSGSWPTPTSISPPSCIFTTTSRGTAKTTPVPSPAASLPPSCPVPQPARSSTPSSNGTPFPAPSQLHDPATPPSSPMLCFSPPFRSAQRPTGNGQRGQHPDLRLPTTSPYRRQPPPSLSLPTKHPASPGMGIERKVPDGRTNNGRR